MAILSSNMVKQRDSYTVKIGGRFLIFRECRYIIKCRTFLRVYTDLFYTFSKSIN